MERARWIVDEEGLRTLVRLLVAQGYVVIGPQLREEAIVFAPIEYLDDLPRGWGDEQEAGTYSLRKRDDMAWFGYTTSPYSAKRYLFPERQKISNAQVRENQIEWWPEREPVRPFAFFGIRPCDARAIALQDRIFLGQDIRDASYERRRSTAILIVAQCGEAGRTCFCSSMQTGPRAGEGFDIALTEILESGLHYFVCEDGSHRGAELLDAVVSRKATPEEWDEALSVTANAERMMGRSLAFETVPKLLTTSYEAAHWDDVASRCLSCTNCTMVCPTCFCSGIEEVSGLQPDSAERWRRWSSCFECEFSHIHGCVVRPDTRSQYRQWLTHKLGTWHDQFGTSGCVGCGRCITWCPVGIDITEEVRAIGESRVVSQSTAYSGQRVTIHPSV